MKQTALAIACISLLLPALLHAQTGEEQLLQSKFEAYQRNHLQEKVFLHVDRNFYNAGELCWFSAYVLDASTHRLLDLSRVLYVELINAEGKAVQQAKLAMDSGRGHGSFLLLQSLSSGSYLIRAYTARMQNDGPDKFYQQAITIANTLRDPSRTATPSNFLVAGIFPEGGNLVNGLASTLAIELTDRYGTPSTGKGILLNNLNDTLARFDISMHGVGRVSIQPEKDRRYRILLVTADTVFSKDLPAAYEEGLSMHVADSVPGNITVLINGSPGYAGEAVYLLAHNRGRVRRVQASMLTNGHAAFVLSSDSLGEGITHLTVFNNRRQPVCERLVFLPGNVPELLSSSINSTTFAPRSPVDIRLQPAKNTNNGATSLSIAVFWIDSFQRATCTDLPAWLLLQSEMAVPSTIPASYCTGSSHAAKRAMNDLMLTRGWRRFNWDAVLKDDRPYFNVITEAEGPVVSGTMQQKVSGKPAPPALAFMLTVPGERFDGCIAITDSNGVLRFPLRPFFGNSELVITAVNPADSMYKFTPAGAFAEGPGPLRIKQWKPLPEMRNELLERSIATQVDNAYETEKKKAAFELLPASDTLRFYGRPDKSYYLDDYTRFVTMEEVVRELLTTVKAKRENGGYTFYAVNTAFKEFFDNPPLVMVDGVPVTDHSKIMGMDPLRIKKIDVINQRYVFGPMLCEGILSFQTYAGDLAGYELDKNAVVVEFDGIQQQRQFYSPAYESASERNSRLPDTRNLLFWAPAVTLRNATKELKFYTSDRKGKYAAVIQALSHDGKANTKLLEFEVR